ncbi:MAG: hypothetical protein LBS58_03405 [Coriobacteriales bacterium]|nr:hypothetical protein [Coriobacteriales bacterium]
MRAGAVIRATTQRGFAPLCVKRHKGPLPPFVLRDRRGQVTVEYLVVGLVLLAIITTLGLLGGRLGEGLFVTHAAESASHAATTNSAGAIGDVLLY